MTTITITITFDPDDPTDVARARRHLARFSPDAVPGGTPEPDGAVAGADAGSVSGQELRDRIIGLVRGYGQGRHRYLRVVAEASPEAARYDDIERLFESPKGIGGTHSSIERSWRAMGGTRDIIETDMHGNARMDPAIARIVLEVLDEYPASS